MITNVHIALGRIAQKTIAAKLHEQVERMNKLEFTSPCSLLNRANLATTMRQKRELCPLDGGDIIRLRYGTYINRTCTAILHQVFRNTPIYMQALALETRLAGNSTRKIAVLNRDVAPYVSLISFPASYSSTTPCPSSPSHTSR